MDRVVQVTEVKVTGDHVLHLVFADGVSGDADMSWVLNPEYEMTVFEALRDPGFFARVYLDGGTVAWPSPSGWDRPGPGIDWDGADLDPCELYASIRVGS